MKIILNLLGFVLHVANSNPPPLRQARDEFFDLKDALLKKYGTPLMAEIQHIKKECWSCEGTGDFDMWGLAGDARKRKCRKCGGSGIFEEFWVILNKYRLGRHHFHIPVVKYHRRDLEAKGFDPPGGRMINGHITHRGYPYYLSYECFCWLALIFNPRFFLRSIGHIRYLGPRFTPMVLLNNGIYLARDKIHVLRFWINRRPKIKIIDNVFTERIK